MAKNDIKLLIEVKNSKSSGCVIQISQKANALLDEVTKKSGNTKANVASRLIEFAYEYVEYVDGNENSED